MVIYSRNDLILCLTFPSSRKILPQIGSTPCLYILSTTSRRCPKRFSLNTSRREAKRNNNYLLTIKMRQSDSVKSYIGYCWPKGPSL